MKNWIAIVVAALALSATAVHAADKVAVLDIQKAIASTNAAQQKGKELQDDAEFKKLVAEIETLRSELQAMNKNAEKNRMTWSAEQAAEQQNKMEFKYKDLQLAGNKLKQMEQMAMQNVLAKFKEVIGPVIEEVVKEEGIGLLLKSDAAHMASPAFDITGKVTAKLNSK